MIFNQLQTPQCKGFSFLGALSILDKKAPIEKIDAELRKENGLLTAERAGKWFKSKWYIKDFRPIEDWQISILLRQGIPLITGSALGDFSTVKGPEYTLGFGSEQHPHSYIIISETPTQYVCQNSWGELWGKRGLFYVNKSDFKRLTRPYRIVTNSEKVESFFQRFTRITSSWFGKMTDYDNYAGNQCVDYARKICSDLGRTIGTFSGSAYRGWITGSPFNEDWERVYYLDGRFPNPGDVVFFDKTPTNKNGHVVISHVSTSSILSLSEQNAGTGNGDGLGKNAIRKRDTNYNGCLGWFTYIGN